MKELICFYKNDSYIQSSDYTLLHCPENKSVNDFLKAVETDFYNSLKILQICFEADEQVYFLKQKPLYPAAKASVFIIHSYNILPDLKNLSSNLSAKPVFQSSINKQSFIEKVFYTKEQISQGRVYQINLSAPLKAKSKEDSFDLFKYYNHLFQGTYKALLPLQETSFLSFSPELFLLRQGSLLITQPIKGSSKSTDPLLLNSPKEAAELSMIVDLLRNDLNRIEEQNSAKVRFHRKLMSLNYIDHTYSQVEIMTEKSLPHILNCALPGGSISGCPKIESLKLIAELENFKRQMYTGVHGWWQNSDFCLAISIRTMIQHHEEIFYHAGCGIVHDSVPEKEWDEFLIKTGNLIKS